MTVSILQERETSATASASSIALAFSSNVTAGSSIHSLCASNSDNASYTCADTANGSYGAALDNTANSLGLRLSHFKLDGSAAGADTVTSTLNTATANPAIWIREIGGTSGYDTHKANAQGSPGTGTDAVTTGTAAPSVQPGLLSGFCFNNIWRTPLVGTGFTSGAKGWLFGNAPGAEYAQAEHVRYTATTAIAATFTVTTGGGTDTYLTAAAFFKESAAATAPFKPVDTDERVFPRGPTTDFAPPNLLTQQTLKLPPFIQEEIWPRTFYRGVHTDFHPPNLLTQGTLKLPPFIQSNDGARTFWKGVYTDFSPPNLLASKFLPPPPVPAVDLSQQVKAKWASIDFSPPNLLVALLPVPPTVPGDWNTGIRVKGVYTDFAAPNLILNTLAPPPPAPLLPQDISGIRLDAKGLRSDFLPPNLTLLLPVAPLPVSTGAGRHKSRQAAHQRHRLDILRAQIDAFKGQRADAELALIRTEDVEVRARTRVLKRVRLKKPVEQYAQVSRAITQRNVALERHRAILRQLEQAQATHAQIEREIEAADEEAALYLMHFLMMETEWRE